MSAANDCSNERGPSATLSLFRFSLAVMVMATHLGGPLPLQLGRCAVEAFFCISGFLITMVANGRYADRPLAFLANRFLRIYPTYWVCLMIGFAIVSRVPDGVYLHPSLYTPATWHDAVANIFVFGLTQQTASRLLPAAWSLHTELWFYLLIGLITARKARLTLVVLAASTVLSMAAAAHKIGVPFYGTPLGNGYAFFIGSAVWHYRHYLRGWSVGLLLGAGLLAFEALAWSPAPGLATANIFLAAPAAGLMLLGLWNSEIDMVLGRARGFCVLLGRLAYPVFLLHWPMGLLTFHLFGVWHSWGMLAGAASLSISSSLAIIFLVEKPIEKWRARIRGSLKFVSGVTMPEGMLSTKITERASA